MKNLIILILLWPLTLFAVNPSYTSFDGTQFVTNGPSLPISIKNGALQTNITFVGPFNIVDPSNTNNAVFQYVPGLSQITLNNQGLISGGTITAAHFIGDGSGISNVIARGPFTNMTIFASNNGPAITINIVSNAATLLQVPTTNLQSTLYWNIAPFANNNAPFPNYPFNLGFNQASGGGAVDSTKGFAYIQIEPGYVSSPGAIPQTEIHLDMGGTNLLVHPTARPWFATQPFDGASLQETFEASDYIWYDLGRTNNNIELVPNVSFVVNGPIASFKSTNEFNVYNTASNNPAGLAIIGDFGRSNYTAHLDVVSKTNQVITGDLPGDISLTLGGGNGHFKWNFNGSYSYDFGPTWALFNQGGLTCRGITNNFGYRGDGGFTNSSGTSLFGGSTFLFGANVTLTLGNAGATTTPSTLSIIDYLSSGTGGPGIVFNGGSAANFGIGTEASGGGLRIGHLTGSGYNSGVVRGWPTSGFTQPINISDAVTIWNSEIVSNSVTSVTGQFNGNGAGLTNIPPASVTGRSYVQTNFVLNTVYAASSGSFTTVAGTAIITAAAAVGNVELDVMYQAGGSGAYTAISAPSLTTTVLSIVMPYQIPFSATFTNGNYYLTNATTTAGGNATLKSGTGTLTTF